MRMNEYTEKKLAAFMSILRHCGLNKEEIFAITSMMKTEDMMMKTEDMMLEIAERLEAEDFKTTHRQTMKICGHVIKEYLEREK